MSNLVDKPLWRNRRVKVPTILQMEATECGAASLAMILAHHGKFVPLEQLRIDCGVSRDGSSAKNILQAARNHGMAAKAFRCELDKLQTLSLPLILYWEFRHFVVLEGRKGDSFFINDPAGGPRPVGIAEFGRAYTGVCLQAVPGPEFERSGTRPSLLRGLFARVAPMRTALVFLVLTSLLLALPGVLLPAFARVFIDEVLGPNPRWLMPLLLGVAGATFLNILLTWMQRSALRTITTNFLALNAPPLFRHLLRLPIAFHQQRSAGELNYRLKLNDLLSELICGQVGQAFTSLFLIGFYAALMLMYDVPLALLGIGIGAFNLLLLWRVAGQRKVLNQTLVQEKNRLMGVATSGIQLIETIKASATENDFFARWAAHQVRDLNAEQRMSRSTIRLSCVPVLLNGLNHAAVLSFGAWRVIEGDLSIGMLVAFQMLMGAFLAPISQFVLLGGQVQEARGAMDKLDDIARQPQDPMLTPARSASEATGAETASPAQTIVIAGAAATSGLPDRRHACGELILRDVSFGYSRLAPPLLSDFSLHIKPGQRVAIVGRSGSGKSTVAKLASGLYGPWSGEILLDGRILGEWSRPALAATVAVVDQEIILFRDSLRDNLSMWNPLMRDDRLFAACKDAEIHAEIGRRQGGYAARVDEAGRNFSGGQRQRLEIARALAQDPVLLIMDEATSALDPETEQLIDHHIRRRGCSCLIVAHRLSTIRDCDEIIVLDAGRIAQRGSHAELIRATDGIYARLMGAAA